MHHDARKAIGIELGPGTFRLAWPKLATLSVLGAHAKPHAAIRPHDVTGHRDLQEQNLIVPRCAGQLDSPRVVEKHLKAGGTLPR